MFEGHENKSKVKIQYKNLLNEISTGNFSFSDTDR